MSFELLPLDVQKLILALLSPKTRADICSVSSGFNVMSVGISSARWPIIDLGICPEVITSQPNFYRNANLYRLSKQVISDYHLLVRTKKHQLLSTELAYRTGDRDTINLVMRHIQTFSVKFQGSIVLDRLIGVCRNGDINLIKTVLELDPNYLASHAGIALRQMCRGGHLNIVIWFLNDYIKLTVDCHSIIDACRSGNLELVKWLFGRHSDLIIIPRCIASACRGNHTHILEYFIATYTLIPADLQYGLVSACVKGFMSLVRYFISLDVKDPHSFAICAAGEHGFIEIVKYLCAELKYTNYDYPYFGANMRGQLEVMKYLQENHKISTRVNTRAFLYACSVGDFEIIKYALSRGILENNYSKAILIAYKNQQYAVVKYIYTAHSSEITYKFTHNLINKLRNRGFIA